jgi:hypothetical protein
MIASRTAASACRRRQLQERVDGGRAAVQRAIKSWSGGPVSWFPARASEWRQAALIERRI